MKNAKEMKEITDSYYNGLLDIEKQIKKAAKDGDYSIRLHDINEETRAKLIELGYSITKRELHDHNLGYGIYEYIDWGEE
jgi:hypothetical protein